MDDNARIFKSYLRGLLRDLQDIAEALDDNDCAKAHSIVNGLIRDTLADIEDD